LKILIVSSAFYPEISPRSFRATELAKELARQGHRVTVYTLLDAAVHEAYAKQYNLTIKDLGKQSWQSISIKGGKFSQLFRRITSRVLLMLVEYPNIELAFMVKKVLAKETECFDLLISVAVPYPNHWGVAWALHKKSNLATTWIADCGDPYMFNKTDSFKKLFYFKYLEKWFCGKANFITVPTEGSRDGYYPEFRQKIKVVPQGFDFRVIKLSEQPVNNQVPTFAYAGVFIAGIRDPKEFLAYLCSQPLAFKFIIYTNMPGHVAPYVLAANGQIEVRAYIPREELLYELSKMDFLVNFGNGTAVQTPSKLIDYALVKRPVLSVETNQLNQNHVNEFLQGNYLHQMPLPTITQYDIANVAAGFVKLTMPENQ
jgi:glycosyltransferase involved in cell wall biosynthesis